MKTHYKARLPRKPVEIGPDERDFLERRTRPFLDRPGIERPLIHLLQEAYLQGCRDTVDIMAKRSPKVRKVE